ncbi:hypothetical protein [Lutibacter sp.]
MKNILKQSNIILVLILVTITSCEYHQSTKKDLTTGAVIKENNLKCTGVTIKQNTKIVKTNTFSYNDEIVIIFDEVTGLKKQSNNFVYPAMSMSIIKNDKEVIISEPNLLKDLNGTDLTPLQLSASFKASFDYETPGAYKTIIKIWDLKGDGTITYEYPFKLKAADDEAFIIQKSEGVIYKNIYLINKSNNKVVGKVLDVKNTYSLIFEGLKGLNNTDMVYPDFSVKITDNNGKLVYNYTHLLKQYETVGVDAKLVEKSLFTNISFQNISIANPYHLTALVKDLKTNNYIQVKSVFELK